MPEGRIAVKVEQVPADLFIAAYAERLEEVLELPRWADYVKTSRGKKLPPADPKWFYTRAASICRKVYFGKNLGVGMLKRKYSFKQRKKILTGRQCLASKGIIRNILQQLEKAKLVEKIDDPEGPKGRRMTKKGKSDMLVVAQKLNYQSKFHELCPDSKPIEQMVMPLEEVAMEEGGEAVEEAEGQI